MDLFLFEQINGLAGKFFWLDNLAIFFAEYLRYVLAGLTILIFWKKRKALFQAFLAAVLARFGIVEIIRFLFFRPRPFLENATSFPSGHAAFFFALSFVVYSYNKKAGIGFFLASFLMGVSRVFIGVHWPSDILGGMIVGIFSGWLVLKIFKK